MLTQIGVAFSLLVLARAMLFFVGKGAWRIGEPIIGFPMSFLVG